jgi:hypothetical protein
MKSNAPKTVLCGRQIVFSIDVAAIQHAGDQRTAFVVINGRQDRKGDAGITAAAAAAQPFFLFRQVIDYA